MLHMRERTAQGLLRRGLASIVQSDEGEAVQLHFRPLDRYDYAGLDAAERNACVGCGSSGVARYYVVPHMFFVHLPDVCKSYNCHDVVMLCPRCRFKAEPAQEALVQEYLKRHGARKAGDRYANDNLLSPEQRAAKRAASILLRPPSGGKKGRIPHGKVQTLRQEVAVAFGIAGEDLTLVQLERAYALGEGPLPSERICSEVSADSESLREFLRRWRETFYTALQPRFLAEGWSVNSGLEDGRFVPSVASTLEWPGDWRCPECGVHCFGRNRFCRKCGFAKENRSSNGESFFGVNDLHWEVDVLHGRSGDFIETSQNYYIQFAAACLI